jgi:hypothetical protein
MVEIFVTTAKRPVWCLNLLHELEHESKRKYNVRVFHDYFTGDEYSEVVKFCQQRPNFFYYKTKLNFGRDRFYELNNLMYCFLETLKYDYFIQIVDDLTLVENFTERACNLVTSEINICNWGTVNVHVPTFFNLPKKVINGVEMVETNWVDCGFVALPEVMNGIRIGATHRHAARHRGSGVGQMFQKAYFEKFQRRIWQTKYALVQHLGIEVSAMHERERRYAYYGDVKEQNDPLQMHLSEQDKLYTEPKFLKLWQQSQSIL